MNSPRALAAAAVVLAVLLIVIGVVYIAEPAHSLPGFFPGHVSASDSGAAHHHAKHGIAAFVVALALLAFAWFRTGPSATRAPAPR